MAVTTGSKALAKSTLYMLLVLAPRFKERESGQLQFFATLPPSVQSHHGVRPYSRIHLGFYFHPAVRGFDNDPVSVDYATFSGRLGMDLQCRIGKDLAQIGHIAQPAGVVNLGSVEIGEAQWIFLQKLGRAGRALGWLHPDRQRVKSVLLESRVVDRDLALGQVRRLGKPGADPAEYLGVLFVFRRL